MRAVATILVLSVGVWAAACGWSDGAPSQEAAEEAEGDPGERAADVADEAADESTAMAAATRWVLPVPELDYNAREGRAVYLHYCAPCHGTEGQGDGFNAFNLDPKPRDLGDPEFQSQRATEDLVAVVRSGGGVAGLSTGMPPWGRTLNDRQIRNVVGFLRTLADGREADARATEAE